jgi:tetratricopeptide (TPR) repeat protein
MLSLKQGTITIMSTWQDGGAMPDLHPMRMELEDFMLGKLSQRESRRVILHLLPGCSHCQSVTAAFWNLGDDGDGNGRVELSERFRYESAMNRVLARVRTARAGLETERAGARERMAELEAMPRDRWPALVQADPRFHTWGVCELLLDRAQSSRDLGEAGLCAGLTVILAGRIGAEAHPQTLVQDLTARAWTALADARRQAGELHSAEEALRRAEAHLQRGTGDRLEKARLLERKAALRTSQERPGEAARLLSRAILLYRRMGQWDRVGRIYLDLGLELGYLRRAAETAVLAPARRGVLSLLIDRLRRLSARLPSRPPLRR